MEARLSTGPRTTLSDLLRRALGISWAFVMASLLLMGMRDHRAEFSSRHECGSDPREILRAGELLDRYSLNFIVAAHCTNARYVSEGRIAVRYIGGDVDI